MKRIITGLMAVTAVVLLLSGCDLLQQGLSTNQKIALASNIGTGSVKSTWTYFGTKTQDLTALTGNLLVTFTQPVQIALDASSKELDSAELTVSFVQNALTITKVVTVTNGVLSADGLTFAIPLTDIFALAKTGVAVTYDKMSDDGKMTVKASVKGFVSKDQKDGSGTNRPVPTVNGTVVIQPVEASVPTLSVLTDVSANGKTVSIPVSTDGLSWDSLTYVSTGSTTAASVLDSNYFSAAYDSDKANIIITIKDPTDNMLNKMLTDVVVKFNNLRSADSGQVAGNRSYTLNFYPVPAALNLGGSSVAATFAMTKDTNISFTAVTYLGVGSFTMTKPDTGTVYGKTGAIGSAAINTNGAVPYYAIGSEAIPVSTAGTYLIYLNIVTNKVFLVPVTSFGIIGAATAGGWGAQTAMTYDQTTDSYSYTGALTADEFKFRINDNWDLCFGLNNLDAQKTAGVAGFGTGGSNIKVSVAGTGSITFNGRTLKYTAP